MQVERGISLLEHCASDIRYAAQEHLLVGNEMDQPDYGPSGAVVHKIPRPRFRSVSGFSTMRAEVIIPTGGQLEATTTGVASIKQQKLSHWRQY
jgi:hypothetical protein